MKSTAITREEIFQYAKEKFGTNPEYLWIKSPKMLSCETAKIQNGMQRYCMFKKDS